jgi:hypothetical protein
MATTTKPCFILSGMTSCRGLQARGVQGQDVSAEERRLPGHCAGGPVHAAVRPAGAPCMLRCSFVYWVCAHQQLCGRSSLTEGCELACHQCLLGRALHLG